jgi:hypothetical protein
MKATIWRIMWQEVALPVRSRKRDYKGEPVSIAILTKPFLDLRKTTCQLQNLFIIITFTGNIYGST